MKFYKLPPSVDEKRLARLVQFVANTKYTKALREVRFRYANGQLDEYMARIRETDPSAEELCVRCLKPEHGFCKGKGPVGKRIVIEGTTL